MDNYKQGKATGSSDWRYFLIEETQNKDMPVVSTDYLHEIIYGTIRVIKFANNSELDPYKHTYSCRLHLDREKRRQKWWEIEITSGRWEKRGDRLEILWGPDYRGRYDLSFIETQPCLRRYWFGKIPDKCKLPTIDKTKEIEAFNVEEDSEHWSICRRP